MGWGRMLLLGNWGQQMDIEDTQNQIRDLRNQINAKRTAEKHGIGSAVDQKQNQQIAALQRENEALELCVASLSRILLAKGIVTHDEFNALAALIDNDASPPKR